MTLHDQPIIALIVTLGGYFFALLVVYAIYRKEKGSRGDYEGED
jgi:hypothetical protein